MVVNTRRKVKLVAVTVVVVPVMVVVMPVVPVMVVVAPDVVHWLLCTGHRATKKSHKFHEHFGIPYTLLTGMQGLRSKK
jgi:hypothetical protein